LMVTTQRFFEPMDCRGHESVFLELCTTILSVCPGPKHRRTDFRQKEGR